MACKQKDSWPTSLTSFEGVTFASVRVNEMLFDVIRCNVMWCKRAECNYSYCITSANRAHKTPSAPHSHTHELHTHTQTFYRHSPKHQSSHSTTTTTAFYMAFYRQLPCSSKESHWTRFRCIYIAQRPRPHDKCTNSANLVVAGNWRVIVAANWQLTLSTFDWQNRPLNNASHNSSVVI